MESDQGQSSGQPTHALAAFRERFYGEYVSCFKGRPTEDKLLEHYRSRARVNNALFGRLIRDTPRGCAIEVGCGDGAFLWWASQIGFSEVVGCDVSAEQVAIARSAGLPARQAPFEELLSEFNGKADLVFAQDVIEHLTRTEALTFLDLAFSSLRDGGQIILTTPNAGALRATPVLYGDLSHETFYTANSVRAMLHLARFRDCKFFEVRPLCDTILSCMRHMLWRVLRVAALLIDVVETGTSNQSQILSRVMIVTAIKEG